MPLRRVAGHLFSKAFLTSSSATAQSSGTTLTAVASASFEKKRLVLAEVWSSAIKSFHLKICITSKDGRPLAGSGKKSQPLAFAGMGTSSSVKPVSLLCLPRTIHKDLSTMLSTMMNGVFIGLGDQFERVL